MVKSSRRDLIAPSEFPITTRVQVVMGAEKFLEGSSQAAAIVEVDTGRVSFTDTVTNKLTFVIS